MCIVWKMKPVTLTLLQGHSKSANSRTPPVQDVPPQTPLDTPLIPSLTTTEDEEVEIDPEQVSEVEKFLNEIVVEEEEIGEEDEEEDEEDENDIGWINEEEGESGMQYVMQSYTKFHEISLSPMSQKCDLDKYQSVWPSRF